MNSIKLNTPMQKMTFHDMDIFIKRDDLINEDFSGNKARKFYYFLINEFPNIKKLVSYGSNQSNAMYSMSVLSRLKGWEFEYYCDHISSLMLENPSGNYKSALDNGAKIINLEGKTRPNLVSTDEILYIPEGGYAQESEYGIKLLADEINEWIRLQDDDTFKIFLPSGTGTTALFLQKHLEYPVYTCACVGDEKYLKQEFFGLESNEQNHPIILQTYKKYHFGKLYKNLYYLWLELKSKTMIEFDLLYDPIGFDTILSNLKIFEDSKIIYIHQGGIKGNLTMLQRYKHKYES
ncbi:MAG: 1-aminocyclopropane-1-carboxylate deaminase/D-cysteine desulfhydrase [Arcobacteraceae bacterium]|jgi:1-aminocyclopropane-1-carboxylate deaminase/D-cysteine desulfhydrase-like pyridoxal-dependent ACC family enzyme|nr:1-aminocyclopropane-1-carboxylate deaminase/D-cysteine desulfhydrase [Arcobacteraceae bacterium]MDY0326832.1 1-aminocyclopropane-1-carboxylate deaminase/D-cysteine desulfhydrase [Arcobacteraceae bacterium]